MSNCKALGVSRSGYYDWKMRPPSTKTANANALHGRIGPYGNGREPAERSPERCR